MTDSKQIVFWFRITMGAMVVLLHSRGAHGQQVGNEWISFNQEYYKINTGEEGLYRIGYSDLQDAGIPVDDLDPRRIQLFHRGQECAIYVEGQLDARFDPADYILFYGQRNDGTLDRALYVEPEAQPHGYYPIYSDTTAYFLTWRPLGNGKRMTFFKENNVGGLPAEPYHTEEVVRVFTTDYSAGLHYPVGVASTETVLSAFDFGEGWTGARIGKGNYQDFLLEQLFDPVTSAPPPVLSLVLAGRNSLRHRVEILVGPSAASLRSVRTVNFNSYYTYATTDTIQWGDIGGDGRMLVRLRVIGVDAADFVSMSMMRLRYAQRTDQRVADSKRFALRANPAGKSYLEISDTPVGVQFLYDITNPAEVVRIGLNSGASGINAIIPNTYVQRTILATRRVIEGSPLSKVHFREFIPGQADYMIVTNAYLRRPTAHHHDPVKAYGAYRASAQGGAHDTVVVNVSQLYDQFSYGETTPLAIYRFMRFMYEGERVKHLFIVGKGLDPSYNFHRRDFQAQEYKDLVPPSGSPGTDILFSSGLGGDTYVPAMSTGRLTAHEAEDVSAYLNKVVEMEAAPYDALWRKRIVHLSGGRTTQEQQRFLDYVNYYESIASQQYLGAEVFTERKLSNNETELLNISEYVNQGLNLITLFGHSSTVANDIEIGFVSNDQLGYRNKGKYPCILVNGCNAGDIYLNVRGFGEDWIYTPDRGALNFIAHTSAGYPSLLNRYSGLFYRKAYADSALVGKGIGEVVQAVIRTYRDQSFLLNQLDQSQIEQMALQGDPAIVLFGADKPDYEVAAENIEAVPRDEKPISAVTPVFDLAIIVRNFGRATTDSIKIAVSRRLSDGSTIHLDTISYPAVFNMDTLMFPVQSIGLEGYGNNDFIVTIDPLNEIEELQKGNNTATKVVFIPLGGTANVYPAPYAIVSETSLRLVAQSLDQLMGERTVVFQIDTSHTFSSPAIQAATVGGRVTTAWDVDIFANIPQQDSTVFYWRSKFEVPGLEEIDEWSMTSFTYIGGSPDGWNMSHFPQFEATVSNSIIADQQRRAWDFVQSATNILVHTFGPDHPDFGYENTTFEVNGQPFIFESRLCRDNAINMVGFNKSRAVPYLIRTFNAVTVIDPRHCGRVPQVINNFVQSDIETRNLVEQNIDRLPEGDYVLMFSNGEVTYESWPAGTLESLAEIGVSQAALDMLQDGYPMIILGRKGAQPGSAIEILPDLDSDIPPREQELVFSEDIVGILSEGAISSPPIGPTANWLSFSQHTASPTAEALDTYSFDIIGITPDNAETVLESDVTAKDIDLSSVDADVFPRLKLRMRTSNPQELMPTQLQRWTILFDEAPEGILTIVEDQPATGIELQEGDTLTSRFLFTNVSQSPFTDSLLVEVTAFNRDLRRSFVDTMAVQAPGPGETMEFAVSVPTAGKTGTNDLKVFVNPYMQPEINYNNNILDLAEHFTVSGDDENPVLEVTVDGEFIMDGDIVSPTPVIVMRVKDENPVLLKQDTTGIELFLKSSCEGCEFERINLSDPRVTWHPATEGSDFRVEYQPETLADGIYTLRAQAEDASGNVSGTEPYMVRFEVINESRITNFFPYPNPFSTSVRFVFTLTGSEIPDGIIIQIMTVSGKVVREITQDEIGPIKIGHNLTEYAWDGRDEYGDQLANGVYLYRVKVSMQGRSVDLRATSADRAFKNGVGKMYLLR